MRWSSVSLRLPFARLLSVTLRLAIVPQDTMLFGGTIRENIAYGRLDASEADILAIAAYTSSRTP